MASSEKFLPLATGEDVVTGIPTYQPNGPGSVSYASSVVDGSIQYSSAGSATGLMVSDGNEGGGGGSGSGSPHLFLNCCCDCRRAVLIVNGIAISFKIISVIAIAIMGSFVSKNANEIEASIVDDEVRKEFDVVFNEGGVALFETIFDFIALISIGLHLCGIYGALKFKKWGIITAGATHALGVLLGVISLDFMTFVISGVCLYPHIIMYKEMREGIMTELNYHKIARCCGDRNM